MYAGGGWGRGTTLAFIKVYEVHKNLSYGKAFRLSGQSPHPGISFGLYKAVGNQIFCEERIFHRS